MIENIITIGCKIVSTLHRLHVTTMPEELVMFNLASILAKYTFLKRINIVRSEATKFVGD